VLNPSGRTVGRSRRAAARAIAGIGKSALWRGGDGGESWDAAKRRPHGENRTEAV